MTYLPVDAGVDMVAELSWQWGSAIENATVIVFNFMYFATKYTSPVLMFVISFAWICVCSFKTL